MPTKPLSMLNLALHSPSWPTLLRHPIAQTLVNGAGIFSLLPIAYSNWPRLRGRLTRSGWTVLTETLDFRRTGISPIFSLLMPTFSLLWSTAPVVTVKLVSIKERSPTPCMVTCIAIASVIRLAPFVFQRKNTKPVSCYAFFKWWLLPSQHPGCLSIFTSFTTERIFWDLSWWSGLFPFRLWSLSLTVWLLPSNDIAFRVSKNPVSLRPQSSNCALPLYRIQQGYT